MKLFSLIIKELMFRKANFILTWVAATVAVAFCVAFFTTSQAADRETRRLMRDMGYNLRIIPKEADRVDFLARGYSEATMPVEYATRFSQHDDLLFEHILATLKMPFEWRGRQIVLNGVASEITGKSPMIFEIEPGTAHVGYALAQAFGVERGEEIEIGGETFRVAGTLSETGSEEDVWLYLHLFDAQRLLGLEGRINEIKALECICRIPGVDPVDLLRSQLDSVFPEAQLFQISAIAVARDRQRKMIEDYFALAVPIVILICGLWIGAMTMQNTRERRAEIGVLRALGYGGGWVVALFLGKAALVGVLGAIVGYLLGTGAALWLGPGVFPETARAIKAERILLLASLLVAPAFAAISSFIPAALAATQDPAVTLREE